ncbi:UDP-4-amino-4,6-dideoxy-N-acetyl-beta-L-altrosamine N-acetyltransferase [Neptunomonas qingdaonensis]|uniref:UDP-4-amino-4,6-dideoxy-N-acetyl-beta-L-altrosamine N-acetyltransferase n=1 Tax=Neptunomonas qingdaonensis TaxID=1045558 RepID=A0A1I2Q0S9_9GAMM|nr:UDP-4-amino-4,6-dideoxy-N-acetyl-beta-L-altrosamine N-acetyltransferase [Neptunomonas qingdaonensis]SFG19231.1 UDP-4-amino-4,6-dideoxy-N-acetyl-beta-L-altrosamine N-acetyltransferase [Neptunomonas qingdaonensis]
MKLRSLSEKDLELVLSWRNHSDVKKWMFSLDNITLENHKRWFISCQDNPAKKLYVLDTGKDICGFIQFDLSGDPENPNIEWGFYRAPDSPAGSGTLLLKLALQKAFVELNANKVIGKVLSYNLASRHVHEKLGFEQEGLLKRHHFLLNDYYDVYCYGLTKQHWKKG